MSSSAVISGKARVEKKKFIKVVLRRLPFGMEQDELLAQLSPLPPYEAFWFRAADLDLLPFAFARAYIVFKEDADAMSFRDRFNGYVFVDRQGNESVGIVEQAPYQDYPKDKPERAKEGDKYVGTIEDNADYLRFLDEYNNLVSKRVANFDELIKEIELKDRMSKRGVVKETPLTDYLYQLAMEKAQRRNNRFDRRYGKSEKAAKTGKWTEKKDKKSAKEPFPRKTEGRDKKPKVEEKFKPEAKPKADRERLAVKPEIRERPKNDERKGPKPMRKSESIEEPVKIMKREETREMKTSAQDKENKIAQEKPKDEIVRNNKIADNKAELNKPIESKNADDKSQPKRNKDRPERQIYQPRSRKVGSDKKDEVNAKENSKVT